MASGIASMARRYVVDTWNNAAAPKKVKPVVPLRHRISPVERDLDQLDSLEAELERERAKGELELDTYHYLRSVLSHRRGTLSLKRRKAVGEHIHKASKASSVTRGTPVRLHNIRPAKASPFQAKLKIVACVFAYFFVKNLLNGA